MESEHDALQAGRLSPLAALPQLYAEKRRLAAELQDVEALIAAYLAELERMEGEA